jgi:hypothetical protein
VNKVSLVGKAVLNKRNGLMGEIVEEQSTSFLIKTRGETKSVSRPTFTRWYTVGEDDVETTTSNPSVEPPVKPKRERIVVSGDKGMGSQLCKVFLDAVRGMVNQNLDITVKNNGKYVIIKYNGRNVFECAVADRRFNVLCHPNSLSPINMNKVTHMYPKKTGWSMRAKFVLISSNDIPLMKSIITDGLYYRQIKEE